jgi:AraC-like DNA-binding protein
MIMLDLFDTQGAPTVFVFKGEGNSTDLFQVGSNVADWHSHRRGQLTYVETGLLHVRTTHGSWLMPPNRAVWIPPEERHWGSMSGVLVGWNVLIETRACRTLPSRPQVVGASKLLRALIERAGAWGSEEHRSPERLRLTSVLIDEIRSAQNEPLHLPMPSDRRILAIARSVLAQPSVNRTLVEWAASEAISPRTARRLFLRETGLTFARWEQQARLLHAVHMLVSCKPVAEIADALGYATPSSFIAMFKRAFRETPGRYLESIRSSKPKPPTSSGSI